MNPSTIRTSALAASAALAISFSPPAQAKCHVAEAWKTYEIDEVIAKSNPPQVSYVCTEVTHAPCDSGNVMTLRKVIGESDFVTGLPAICLFYHNGGFSLENFSR